MPAVAAAQTPAITDASLGGAAWLARVGFFGVEGTLGRREGQTRFVIAGTGGLQGGAVAVRLEAKVQYLLLTPERGAPAYYAGLGLAYAGAAGRRGAAYLTTVVGVETAAWRARGVYAEIGLGGGVRAAAGIRWRQLPAWWP